MASSRCGAGALELDVEEVFLRAVALDVKDRLESAGGSGLEEHFPARIIGFKRIPGSKLVMDSPVDFAK